MQNKITNYFLFLILIFSLSLHQVKAQDNNSLADSTMVRDFVITDIVPDIKNDTIAWVQGDSKLDNMTSQVLNSKEPFKPNSTKAVIYSAIFPGLGQIYNRKYWKLPIIYGGFLGLIYAISWNGKYYNDYSTAYAGIMSEYPRESPNLEKWKPFLTSGVDPAQLSDSQIATLRNSFKRSRDSYRRYRDLSIIGVVALYALCMLDAYVDAELFNFDISPDLSLKVQPTVNPADRYSGSNVGVQCSVTF